MSTRRKDPTAVVVAFFATMPIDEAQRVLTLCKQVVAQRTPRRRSNKIRMTTLAEDAAVNEAKAR
jgi:hypothetical protein